MPEATEDGGTAAKASGLFSMASKISEIDEMKMDMLVAGPSRPLIEGNSLSVGVWLAVSPTCPLPGIRIRTL